MASATVQRKEPAPPEIVSVTLVLSKDEAIELRRVLCNTTSGRLYAIWRSLLWAGV